MVLLAAFILNSCNPRIDKIHAPTTVRPNEVFEIAIDVEITHDPSWGSPQWGDYLQAVVVQIPNDVNFVDAIIPAPHDQSTVLDDPSVLSLYSAEPGHRLLSFSGPFRRAGGGAGVLRLVLQAPTSGTSFSIKAAAAGEVNGILTPQSPMTPGSPVGETSFGLIGASNLATVAFDGAATRSWRRSDIGLPTSGPWNLDLQSGDLNDDGRDDLVSGDLWMRGSAGFSLYTGLPTQFVGRRSIGDFNGDGRDDIAASGASYLFSLGGPVTPRALVGDGNGGFLDGSAGLVTPGTLIGAGDFDGDGTDDIVISGITGAFGALRAYRSDRNGGWIWSSQGLPPTPPDPLSNFPGRDRVELVDVDADGNIDIVETANNSRFFLGDGNGGWAQIIGANLPSSVELSAHDVDGDGQVEFLRAGPSVELYRRNANDVSQWTLDQNSGLANLPESLDIEIVDLNLDGVLDLVSLCPPNNSLPFADRILIYLGQTGGTFASAPSIWASGLLQSDFVGHSLTSGDFDGDGRPDLAVAADDLGIRVFLNRNPNVPVPCAEDPRGDVFRVNGSNWAPSRRHSLPSGMPVVFGVAQPTTLASQASFVIWAQHGDRSPNLFTTPFGNLCLIPSEFASSQAITLASSFGGPALLNASPTPWSSIPLWTPSFPLTLTIQGLVEVDDGASNTITPTNTIVLDVF